MNRIKRLTQSYSKFISIPWRNDAAAAQRVIFCVYNETEERWLRAKIDEFEIATRQAGHEWSIFDLTDTFAAWLTSQRYATSYYCEAWLAEQGYELAPLIDRVAACVEQGGALPDIPRSGL